MNLTSTMQRRDGRSATFRRAPIVWCGPRRPLNVGGRFVVAPSFVIPAYLGSDALPVMTSRSFPNHDALVDSLAA
jgi:hypothetical protein